MAALASKIMKANGQRISTSHELDSHSVIQCEAFHNPTFVTSTGITGNVQMTGVTKHAYVRQRHTSVRT